MEFIRLLQEDKTAIWINYTGFDDIFKEAGAPCSPLEHLDNIRENNGETIIAYDIESKIILGWIGILPKRKYAELDGIEVNKNNRNLGIATKLILHAQDFLSIKNVHEFRFTTSPLLTANTLLYFSKFQTEYLWNNTNAVPPDNTPWPVVDCIMRWPIQKKRITISPEDLMIKNNVIIWNENTPVVNESILSKNLRYHIMELPYIDVPVIIENFENLNFEIVKIPFRIFDEMIDRGYQIRDFIEYNEKRYFIFEKG